MRWRTQTSIVSLAIAGILAGNAASAAELSIVSGAVGSDIEELRKHLDIFEAESGHTVEIVTMPASTTDQFGQYRLWLSAENPDIDVYRVDVIWAPQLANHFVDLSEAAADVVDQHFPAIIESQTVDGRLVALPMFTDAPALYYRKDLLEKHGAVPPSTWVEMTETAQTIMDAERAEGNDGIFGFVWQGAAYEGLTCNALEWVKSNGGGQIVEADGEISINNENAAEMLDLAASWVGTISPPGVLGYREEEARGVWQLGNAVFMRNWPYAYALSNGDDSAVKDLFAVVPLPTGPSGEQNAATLRRLESRRLELQPGPGSGDRDGQVPGQHRDPKRSGDHADPLADAAGDLRGSRGARGAAGDRRMAADLPVGGAAAFGAHQGQLQPGQPGVLDSRACHALGQRQRCR